MTESETGEFTSRCLTMVSGAIAGLPTSNLFVRRPVVGEKETTQFVVQARLKDFLSERDFRCAGDLSDALSVEISKLLVRAMERCKANKRQTVGPQDL